MFFDDAENDDQKERKYVLKTYLGAVTDVTDVVMTSDLCRLVSSFCTFLLRAWRRDGDSRRAANYAGSGVFRLLASPTASSPAAGRSAVRGLTHYHLDVYNGVLVLFSGKIGRAVGRRRMTSADEVEVCRSPPDDLRRRGRSVAAG